MESWEWCLQLLRMFLLIATESSMVTRKRHHSSDGAGKGGHRVRRFRGFVGAWLAVAALLTACQSVPTEQLKAFSTSLTAVQESNKPIFADLAVAELRSERRTSKACPTIDVLDFGGVQVRDGFCLAEASLNADDAVAPQTAILQTGFDAIRQYTDSLLVLAEAKSASDTSAELKGIAANLQGLATIVGLASVANLPIVPAITAMSVVIDKAAAQLSKAEARRLILEGGEHVLKVIAAERNAIPQMRALITHDWIAQRAHVRDVPGRRALGEKINGYDRILSNYALMLDRLSAAWSKAVSATTAPHPVTLTELTTLTSQVKADADAVAKAFAILRAGPTQ